ncbi:MAG: choice-of-anchor D domain-containing protein [Deltaproteobacteria bacterium]|nr:choice-of-anchor D domain-containing protein [Deltaproteobacteria bacterium]
MKTRTVLALAILAAALALIPAPARATLESGVPFFTNVRSKTYANVDIVVPEGATRLTVTLTHGSGDLDLYLKYGSPVEGRTVSELDADADIRADGPTADETITITPATSPSLRAGKWYIATLNLGSATDYFNITATIEVAKPQSTVDFGPVTIGQTKRKALKVTNNGDVNLNVNSVVITGSQAAMFAETHGCAVIPPGGNCSLTISFSPTSTGGKSAWLKIYSNDPDTPLLLVPLAGTGVAGSAANALPLPAGAQTYPAYPAAASPAAGIDPVTCQPVGVGSIAAGGGTVGIGVGLAAPAGPCDVYFGLYAPGLDAREIFLLGQDGAFHPYSRDGLVKWQPAASGKISAKPFGDFSASLLPAGTYNLYLMLTPAGSLDTYYLWSTAFTVQGIPDTVPDGSAGYFNGSLVVPNATIIYQGQSYQGSAPIADDALIGIKKDGQVYLYHPALGQAKLSAYNSRRALGYFMLGMSAANAQAALSAAAKLQAVEPLAAPSATANVAKVIGINQTVALNTGIDIKLLDDQGKVRATNRGRNFAVVKTGTEDRNRYFLPPRSNIIPSEYAALLKLVYDTAAKGEIPDIPSFYSERGDIKTTTGKIETFRAIIRALPVYAKYGFTDRQKKAFEKDRELTIQVNTVDFLYCYLDMLKNLAGLIPNDCADLLLSSGICRGLQSIFAHTLNDPGLASQTNKDTLNSLLSDFAGCVGGVVTAETGEVLNTCMDLLSAFNWVVDDIAWNSFLAYVGTDFDSYDLAFAGTGMLAYRELKGRDVSLVMRNLGDGSSWKINTTPLGAKTYPKIAGITDDGTVVCFVNNYLGSDYHDQLFAVSDWGRGPAVDLLPAPRGQLREIDIHDLEQIDVTGSGQILFRGDWSDDWSKTHHHGICQIWVHNELEPGHVYFDPNPDDKRGEAAPFINSLSVSRDRQKLIFAEGNRLHKIHAQGSHYRLLAAINTTPYKEIEYVRISRIPPIGVMIKVRFSTPFP